MRTKASSAHGEQHIENPPVSVGHCWDGYRYSSSHRSGFTCLKLVGSERGFGVNDPLLGMPLSVPTGLQSSGYVCLFCKTVAFLPLKYKQDKVRKFVCLVYCYIPNARTVLDTNGGLNTCLLNE